MRDLEKPLGMFCCLALHVLAYGILVRSSSGVAPGGTTAVPLPVNYGDLITRTFGVSPFPRTGVESFRVADPTWPMS